MRIYPKCFAHNFGPVGSAIYCNCGNKLFRAIAMNEVNTQQVSIVIDRDGKARCFGQSAPQRIEAYSRVDRFRHARPQEEDAVEADYWFVYAIEFFDADGEITRTQFWVGGAANLLLAEYGAYGPVTPVVVPILSDSDSDAVSSASTTTGPTSVMESSINADPGVSGTSTTQVGISSAEPYFLIGYLASGNYLIDYSVSSSGFTNDVSGSPEGQVAAVELLFILYLNQSPVDLFSIERQTGQGEFANLSNVADTVQASNFAFFASASVTTTNGGVISGELSVSVTATAQKSVSPELQYASKVGDTMYVAIARHPADSTPNTSYPDDLQIDYFSVSSTGQISFTTLSNNSAIADATTTSNDWRKSLLELDSWNNGDFIEIPPSTGNECIDRFRRNALCNYQDNILKVLKVPGYDITAYEEGDGTDADDIGSALSSLLTSNGTFEIEEYLALSTADACTLTLEQSSQRTAVQLSSPALRPGESSKSTTFGWVAP